MKKWILVFFGMLVLSCSILCPIYAQGNHPSEALEEEAVFDENTSDGSDQAAPSVNQLQDIKQKFNLKLYLDVMYEDSLGEEEDASLREANEPSFSTNHTYLMLQSAPTDRLRVGFDIQFSTFYEIEYYPIPSLSFKAGKIILPFGDYKYHPIYGGKVYSIQNDLFPNWFTDYGISFTHRFLDTDYVSLKYDLFTSNGFKDSSDGDLNLNGIGFAIDNNRKKMLGGRLQTTWLGRYNITGSGLQDYWSDDGEATLTMWALDISTGGGLMDLPVLRDIDIKVGYLDKHVENDDASNDALREYDGFGSHFEISTKPTEWLKLVFRLGEVDPNENVQDKMDQRNYNVHSIIYFEEYLEFWAMYQKNEEKYVDEIENDYVALKIVLNY
jgi:hypothetical protein